MITLQNISKTFTTKDRDVYALKDVSIQVERGEIFGVIGFSGAGKSTLLRMINLLEKPTKGEIIVQNQNLLALSDKELQLARKKIGIIFQHFNLLSSYNVYDNVAEILRMHKVPKEIIQEKVQSLLELVGLEQKANHYPAQLSGGQKQRVGIARALAMDPEILLCDEATSALDPQTTDSILELLLDINKKLGLTIVLITHEMGVIKKICHRVAVMEKGEIIEQGEVIDLFSNPQHQTTKRFIKSVFDNDIPEQVLQTLALTEQRNYKIIQITFRGEKATDPVVNTMLTKFSLTMNILSGTISYIQEQPLGVVLLQLQGEEEILVNAIDYLTNYAYQVQVKYESIALREVANV